MPDSPDLIDLYRRMVLIRVFEERAVELRREGRIHGTVHPYIGQEAVATGVCAALGTDDRIASTHRGHGHLLAKGGDPDRTMAELFGRVGGYCRGRGGSMHVADVDLGILGANGIVAAGVPLILGSAFAATYLGEPRVSVAFFGDGATGQGALWESLHLSATWKLPTVWVCENNQYAVHTPAADALPTERIHELVPPATMPSVRVDGNDVEAVHATAAEAVDRARSGHGPTFIEAVTFRTTWHSFRYANQPDRRPQEQRDDWATRDPIVLLGNRLRADGHDLTAVESEVRNRIEEAVSFADASPYPDPSTLTEDVFAEVTR
ncbi:thiamine pyrophosphate-dependent dehydrogenase E1 component subunit alpha [Verrucosispora sp. NA02020]|uniref:thiamine pyrophosphate-dependent dehydrogenase E1 component subunit alpha n=1 Tax=Verrucosispora sp. NA02020 TaxID=2742132 RepID=UPI0015907246|nr:thiamine pyrophosphate-dependent dehydrogenase E1 component subunit alpha [Verrucosispora sp. NA02020]QKW13573.1 thiamine pyrophosphate-dependent dehydrogenase E1 component subunit alpha [Verrucosispora sp. NA02020]